MEHWRPTDRYCYQLGRSANHAAITAATHATITVLQLIFNGRYLDEAEEPHSSNRDVVFTVSDGDFNGVANISLRITPIDDNPTVPIVEGNITYTYTEGGSPTPLARLSLADEDSGNSFVAVNSMTLQIINGSENEILAISLSTSIITVSHTLQLCKSNIDMPHVGVGWWTGADSGGTSTTGRLQPTVAD